jgi:putative membrane protein
MQFLKILFWCLLAFVAALFTYGNWVSVPIRLWGGLVAETNLPALLLVTFLAGLLPTLAWQSALRWRLRQRLLTAERSLAEARAVPPVSDPAPLPAPLSPTPDVAAS